MEERRVRVKRKDDAGGRGSRSRSKGLRSFFLSPRQIGPDIWHKQIMPSADERQWKDEGKKLDWQSPLFVSGFFIK